MITRYAELEDMPQVYVLYLEALRELNEPHDESDALDFMLLCYTKAPCIILENDGNIVGFAGLNLFAPLYDTKRLELHEYMFFITPEYRGIKAWRTLARAVQAVSDKFKVNFVGVHVLSGDIKNHTRLIRMAGATPKAIISVYEAKDE
jgi:Acetyltransferase (GNAT) family